MKRIVTAIVGLCFFAGYNAQANEVKSDAVDMPQVELVADAKSAPEAEAVAEEVVVKGTNEVELVADSKHEPVAVAAEEAAEEAVVADVEEPVVAEAEATVVEETDKVDGEKSDFVEKYITGRLQIGTRMAVRSLTDSDSGHEGGTYGSGTYLGTIYAIDEVQDYIPYLFFMKYFFTDYIAAELAYDSVSGETVASSIGYSGDKTDGEITLSGPTVSLVAHYPNSTKFNPYASVGIGFYSGDFDEASHWGLGYKDPSQYEAMGSPSTSYGGRTREIVIDSEIGLLLGLGCSYSLTENWLIDLSMQYTSVDVDATFYGYTNGVQDTEQDGHFPMDNVAFRLGLAYQF